MALSTVPLQLFRRLIAPLLVLVISVHAVTPLGQPVQRVVGSAFSAETAEVSLRSGQRSVVVKQAELPRSPVALPLAAAMPAIVAVLVVLAPALAGLGPRGPPRSVRAALRPQSPRAPPAA